MTLIQQIAQRLGVPVAELVAIIYYKDPDWSEVKVVSDKETVANCVDGDLGYEVERAKFNELSSIPDSTYTCASESYGVQGGTILLVHGWPDKVA